METDTEININKTTEKDKKLKTEKKILNLSLAGSIMFLLAEIFFAIYTGSKAVLMD